MQNRNIRYKSKYYGNSLNDGSAAYERGVFLTTDKKNIEAYLTDIYIYIAKDGRPAGNFRVHVYEPDSSNNMLPGRDITDSNMIIHGRAGGEWVVIDVKNKYIPVSKGVFLTVESVFNPDIPETPMPYYTGKKTKSRNHAPFTYTKGIILGLAKNRYGRKVYYRNYGSDDGWTVETFTPLLPMIHGRYFYF